MQRWLLLVFGLLLLALLAWAGVESRSARLKVDGLGDTLALTLNRVSYATEVRLMTQLTTSWEFEITPGVTATHTVTTTQQPDETPEEHAQRHKRQVTADAALFPPVEG